MWLLAHGETGSNVATIVSNPEKSKHLETATMRLLGFSVDFVNLRTESYCETSSELLLCAARTTPSIYLCVSPSLPPP